MWEIFVMMWQLCILIVVSVTQIHKCNKIEQNHTHVKLVHSEFCGSYNLYFLVLISCYIYVGFTIRRAVHRTSLYYFFSVQFSRSVVSDSLQIHGLQHARLPCPSSISGATQTHVHRVGDAIQPSPLLSSPSPPAFNLSQHQGLFQWASFSHQVTKVLEFQLQHSPSNEYSGLFCFRIDWFDLAVQGILKSLLQHHSSKALILWHSAFFIIQLSHPYVTTGSKLY